MTDTNPSPKQVAKQVAHVQRTCLCLHLQKASRTVARRFDEVFRPLEITSGQYSLLVALARPNPPSIGQLAQAMGMDRTTITANIKPLKRRGLVDIVPAPSDARSRLLTLTLEGKTLLQRALPLWQTAQDQMLEGLSAEGGEGEQLLMMLRQVAD